MTPAFRVLGIDASLRSTGLGVVESCGTRLAAVALERITTSPSERHSACLVKICTCLSAVIARTTPAAAAIEGGFFHRNARTADVLGQVRGAVIATCAGLGLPVYEYAPRRVKQAVVGYGAAEKAQVRRMVMQMLGLSEEPQEDAGDALAIAICHLHTRTGHAALNPEPI